MGQVKQWMFDKQHEDDLKDFLSQLMDRSELEGAIEGITKFLLTKGFNSLSDKQKYVLKNFAENYASDHECERCGNGNVAALTDHIFISENSLCPMCEYDREKFMRD